MKKSCLAICLLSTIFILMTLAWGQETSALWVVSRPGAPVLETDPSLGVIFELEPDLSAAVPRFQSEGGPLGLDYLRLDGDGTAYISFGGNAEEGKPGGILRVPDLAELESSINTVEAAVIGGENAGLVDPRGVALAHELGFVVVADFNTGLIKVFDKRRTGNVSPTFVIDKLGLDPAGEPRKPWSIELNEQANRLFVASTDGTLLVFDDFFIRQGQEGPDRVIVPTFEGEQRSANLHGVLYVLEKDVVIVSDFGPAQRSDEEGFESDGKIFVINNASRADGETEVAVELSGPATNLGNPADMVFDGSSLYVCEKVFDVVLRFDDILGFEGQVELAPSAAVSVPKPESIVLLKLP